MLKRIASRSLIALSLGLVLTSSFFALTPRAHADSSLLFGQQQAYTAIVRSDKKVVTYAKIYLSNDDTGERKTTSFTIPAGVKVSNLSVYQITLPERCKTESDTPTTSKTYDYYYTSCASLEAQVFGLDNYYYYDSSDSALIYRRISLDGQSGPTYSLTLPEPIAPQKRGAYLVSYIADEGYASGNFGFYNLTFKTLQVPESIQEVRVSVDVSEDLYTKAKRSTISPAATDSLSIASGASSADSLKSKSLDTLQSNIGSGGTFTKTGKSLAPGESLVVNGEFADAAWKLNLWLIVGGIASLLVLVGLTVILMRKAQGKTILPVKGTRHGK